MSSPPPPPTRTDRVPSWEEVARDHGRFLYTVAYRLTVNHDDAQDLVQDVLLRVQRGLATYQPGSMEAWLSRITTNAFLDRVRRQKRRPTDALPEDDPDRVLPSTASAAEALDAAVAARAPAAGAARTCPRTTGPRSCCATSWTSATRRSPRPSTSPWARCAPASTGAAPGCGPRSRRVS